MVISVLIAVLLNVTLVKNHATARNTSKLNIHDLNFCDDMSIEQFLREMKKSNVEQLTYDEMLSYLERNKDISTKRNLSHGDAYWLGRLYDEKQINNSEYKKSLKLLRQSIWSLAEQSMRISRLTLTEGFLIVLMTIAKPKPSHSRNKRILIRFLVWDDNFLSLTGERVRFN